MIHVCQSAREFAEFIALTRFSLMAFFFFYLSRASWKRRKKKSSLSSLSCLPPRERSNATRIIACWRALFRCGSGIMDGKERAFFFLYERKRIEADDVIKLFFFCCRGMFLALMRQRARGIETRSWVNARKKSFALRRERERKAKVDLTNFSTVSHCDFSSRDLTPSLLE